MKFETLGYVGQAILVLVLVMSGCETAADQQQQANEARARETAERAKVQRDLSEEKARAERHLSQVRAEADSEIADAQADFARIREDFRHEVQAELVTLQKDLTDLEIRGRSAHGRQKAKIDAALPEIQEARKDFDEALESLDRATAATWDDTKTIVQKELHELEDLVHQAGASS